MTPSSITPPLFRTLTADGRLLFLTRCVRLFAYGFLSVVLVLYLTESGLTEGQVGPLLTLILLGDTAISLWITTAADRVGRRQMLVAGSLLAQSTGAARLVLSTAKDNQTAKSLYPSLGY